MSPAAKEDTTKKPVGEFRKLEGVSRGGELYEIDPRIIVIEPGFNARNFDLPENKAHVEQLAKSIAEIGLQKPIVVRYEDGQVKLSDGESRLRGTLLAIDKLGAEIKTISATREDKRVSEAERVLGLITHNSGKPLTILEQAEVFNRLHKFKWTDAQIAKAIGLTAAHISSVMKLHAAPEEVKQIVREGKVAASLAINVVRDHGPEKALEVLQEATKNAEAQGKGRATAKHVTTKSTKKKKSKTPIYYQREVVRSFIDVLVDIAGDVSLGKASSGIRKQVRNVLENADIDVKEWAAQAESEEEGVA